MKFQSTEMCNDVHSGHLAGSRAENITVSHLRRRVFLASFLSPQIALNPNFLPQLIRAKAELPNPLTYT